LEEEDFTDMPAIVTRYMPVADNPLALWTAVASLRRCEYTDHSPQNYLAILQHGACLACTRDQAYSTLEARLSLLKGGRVDGRMLAQTRIYILSGSVCRIECGG
jgi:hypothetical protein